MPDCRYERQELFKGIGSAGQKRLSKSRVAVIGMSGTGAAAANYLVRAGIGFIRLVDGDFADITELQRQTVFTEEEIGKLPRAAAAKKYFEKVNTEISIEAVVDAIGSQNVKGIISDVDLVIDGTDSVIDRLLINEACRALGVPWIYGGALAASGSCCVFMPGDDSPCYRCFAGEDVLIDEQPTCATEGILGPVTGIIAALQAAEALKILTGSDAVRKDMVMFDLWENGFDELPIEKDLKCPVCAGGKYEFYGVRQDVRTAVMCGSSSVQIIPESEIQADFAKYAERFRLLGDVRYSEYTLHFKNDEAEFRLFKNGRAMIMNAGDMQSAEAIYDKYIRKGERCENHIEYGRNGDK